MHAERRAANAGEAFARVFVDELAQLGVTDAVLAPGSRSTPLALALDADERLRLHVRIDERSAAFLALGVARASGRPVPVLCTSGTAAAHFHAAVLEADQSRIPLLVLTADRPPELRGIGANQTIDQVGLYGGAVRWSADVDVPVASAQSVSQWRTLAARAVATALGSADAAPGPVHLNLPLREPLTPTDDGVGFPFGLDEPREAAGSRDTGGTPRREMPADVRARIEAAAHGVVVAGDGLADDDVDALLAFAARKSWPVIAEPHSNARHGPGALRGTDAVLRDSSFVTTYPPELTVVCGRVGLSRALLGWLSAVPHVVLDRYGARWDPTRSADAVVAVPAASLADCGGVVADVGWLDGWQRATRAAAIAVDAVLDESVVLSEPRVARDVARLMPPDSTLVVASSMPIRDLDLTLEPDRAARIVANRGVSGIDGFVSTSIGVALATAGRTTVALAGDLSLLHDSNGFVGGSRPDLTFVVINNDGGGIFSLLPQAGSTQPAAFERLFGTPHGVDLRLLAAAYDLEHHTITTADDLAEALAKRADGLRLLEVRTDRTANAALHDRLRTVAAAAVRDAGSD